jgi:amidase
LKTWKYDGGADIHGALALSGEPIVAPVKAAYGTSISEAATPTFIAETNVLKREYQKEYMEYWNGTAAISGTGRPVDAVITPLAPFPAAIPNKYDYYGKSTLEMSAN